MPDADAPRRVPTRPLAIAAVGLVAIVGLSLLGRALPRAETWERSAGAVLVSSWAPYWQPEASIESFRSNARLFSDVSVVAYSATSEDSIALYPQLSDTMIPSFREAARDAGVPVLATIFDDSPAGTMAAVLADPGRRTVHVDRIMEIVAAGGTDGLGFDGVDLDYERFAFADGRSTWATTRPNWIAFLSELSTRLRPLGKLLVVSVPPVYDAGQTDASGYWVYDYAAMGPLVDRIRVMTYDYSIPAGAPGPIAPISWVEQVIESVTALVPPSKIHLGIPTYGYDWVVDVAGTCPADQTPESRAMSTARAARTVTERGLIAMWDDATAERRFDYVDELSGLDAQGSPTSCAVTRTVRYLDAEAIHRRTWLAHRSELHGVALWALGNDDDRTWDGIRAAVDGQPEWGDITVTSATGPGAPGTGATGTGAATTELAG
ncbi:MAG: hypothetical protein RI958_1911 [Actinomycetota bacterium]|jgi:spore germination protein YaaH